MHPRNPYKEPPDFLELAQAYPELKPFVYISKKGNPSINFKDADGLRLLTLSLLHRDFGLDLELSTDRLCPAIPNRLNYILWIQDILANSSRPDETVRGIDIGTGASVIYPLLACKLSPSWVFVATDIDTRSLMVAESNVARNGLQNRIIVKQSLPDGPIISDVLLDPSFPAYDFVMCNPPFYGSREEVDQATEDKEFDPSAACTGADFEMITPGGEGVFVTRIVNESVDVGKRCRWFTSLLGKHTSVAAVVAAIKGLKIDNYGITEFIQGNTRRWGVVWSFSDERLPDNLIRPSSDSLHSLQPPSNQLRQPILSTVDPVMYSYRSTK
ncbi:hypothetical protein PIIN_06806 [Serendipita indica DSM 11827]|uniref:U6 small nuclear RNA (adenine-(43)-N(6))-methyltransferase n=1 Tax=Serendipita indica (strain DSM 11827) TaxID=1109443 RepID=G4TNH7_SERID|nr:hypothetical protein PIIN_06806 [Serendipita indica DSM 11827]